MRILVRQGLLWRDVRQTAPLDGDSGFGSDMLTTVSGRSKPLLLTLALDQQRA
jgi:hypothetical protein